MNGPDGWQTPHVPKIFMKVQEKVAGQVLTLTLKALYIILAGRIAAIISGEV